MPTKIGITMSEKIGSRQCESLGVSCSLEFDDDSPALQNRETLQLAVDSAALACHRTLQEESIRLAADGGRSYIADFS